MRPTAAPTGPVAAAVAGRRSGSNAAAAAPPPATCRSPPAAAAGRWSSASVPRQARCHSQRGDRQNARLAARRVVIVRFSCSVTPGCLQHGAAHQGGEDRQLVGVVVQRRGTDDRRFAGLTRHVVVDHLSGQRRLGLRRSPGYRRGGAQHDGSVPAAPVGRAIQHHRDIGDRPVERRLLGLFQEHRTCAG